jgi:hypothetical protein
MEGMRYGQQHLADPKKDIPYEKKTEKTLQQNHQPAKAAAGGDRKSLCQPFEALAAQHAVIVFGDAFPAEEAPALRTADHRLTVCVLITALVA